MKNTGLHDILDELRDKESLHVEIGWHPNGYAYAIYRIPAWKKNAFWNIVKAMNLAD